MNDEKPDEDLLKDFWTDTRARDLFFARVTPGLERIARGILKKMDPRRQHAETQDLVNTVVKRVLKTRSRPTFQNRRQFYVYFGKTARHALRDYCRKRKTQKRGGGRPEIPLQGNEPTLQSHVDEALHVPARCDEVLQVDAYLEKTSPESAEIVLLHYFLGLSFKEIGEVLKISSSRVRSIWRVFVARLSEFLKDR